MSEAAERVPGDPRYVRQLWRGEVAMPALTTARARWEARQAGVIHNIPVRARMLLAIFDQFIEEIGPGQRAEWTLAEVRKALAALAATDERDD